MTDDRHLSGRLLVVDDEEGILSIVAYYLRNTGLTIETALNGLNALAKIKKKHFDFIITDLVLPGLDGEQLINEAKKASPKTRFVIMTGGLSLDHTGKRQDKIQRLCDRYLTKPFERDELIDALRALMPPSRMAKN